NEDAEIEVGHALSSAAGLVFALLCADCAVRSENRLPGEGLSPGLLREARARPGQEQELKTYDSRGEVIAPRFGMLTASKHKPNPEPPEPVPAPPSTPAPAPRPEPAPVPGIPKPTAGFRRRACSATFELFLNAFQASAAGLLCT